MNKPASRKRLRPLPVVADFAPRTVRFARLAGYALAAIWIAAVTVFYVVRFWAAFYRANAGRLNDLLDRIF